MGETQEQLDWEASRRRYEDEYEHREKVVEFLNRIIQLLKEIEYNTRATYLKDK